MYKPVRSDIDFPRLEEEILAFWNENEVFQKSVEARRGRPEYIFFDGPPFATGLPHFGHFVPSTIKDIIPRYRTMKGFHVPRRFGWDCHGLPVENLIEKELGLNSKTDIEKFGVVRFNDACRDSVLRYVREWREIISRLGRWVDFDNDYKTMESGYMESIWWVVKTLWERGLLYEGYYILPYCPRCSTVLSNHELNLGGYRDVHDPAVTVRFKVREGEVSPPLQPPAASSASPSAGGTAPRPFAPSGAAAKVPLCNAPLCNAPLPANTYFLAWTTTPWTLPSNLALTLGPDIDYVLIEAGTGEQAGGAIKTADSGNKGADSGSQRQSPGGSQVPAPPPPAHYILAGARLPAYFKTPDEYKIIWRKKGAALAGIEYEPLFPYFAGEREHNAFRTYLGDFVSTEDGTGIVHTAPGFGEDDNRILKGTGVPVICPVDAECRFTADVPDYEGRFVKDCDKDITGRLKREGKLFRREQVLHSYPHCWRCGHPLIYRAVSSWFVNVQKIKADMLEANSKIDWIPAHIKSGRFGKWLEGARDWAISRNRYWGNPIPIWKCPDCGRTICVGSRAELKALSGAEPDDLHKQFVDKITIKCGCGGVMRRIPEVLDCWFESGSMPYAQVHYMGSGEPGAGSRDGQQATTGSPFPTLQADFITEGLDQTRGWFYTLTVLAAALFKQPAFRHCIVTGLVLAKDGKKMSKSLRNYTDPAEAINKFGADALRLFLIHSAVIKADDLRYSDEAVKDALKSVLLPLWNAYSFFVTYANIDGFTGKPCESGRVSCAAEGAAEDAPFANRNPLDRWIISLSQNLILKTEAAMEAYDLSTAIDGIVDFIDLLNNWYIRRSRRRFWKSENDADKYSAYSALYYSLRMLISAACPFIPFTTEAVYQNLKTEAEPLSLHLTDFPKADGTLTDKQLEFRMAAVRRAVSLGRALRSGCNIKVRQPLASCELVTRDPEEKACLVEMQDIIREELNVRRLNFPDNEEELVIYAAKPNFRVLGKELGKDMKAFAGKIESLTRPEIETVLSGGSVEIEAAGRKVSLDAAKLEIRRIEKSGLKILNEGSLTVALDTEITPELEEEGKARDLVRAIQNLRKESGLDVSDRIKLFLSGGAAARKCVDRFASYIKEETLAAEIIWEQREGQSGPEDISVSLARV